MQCRCVELPPPIYIPSDEFIRRWYTLYCGKQFAKLIANKTHHLQEDAIEQARQKVMHEIDNVPITDIQHKQHT